MTDQTLPPIKAKQPGRNGRKHTLGRARLNEQGKVEVYLSCLMSRCGCSGWYVLEELLKIYEDTLRGKDKEAA